MRELDDPTQMDVANYDMTITDRNSHILWDNSLDETSTVVYTPHATWNTDDRTPAFDHNGDPIDGVGKIAHADFMTSRILYHADAKDDGILSIVNKNTNMEVVRVNLPTCSAVCARARRYTATRNRNSSTAATTISLTSTSRATAWLT